MTGVWNQGVIRPSSLLRVFRDTCRLAVVWTILPTSYSSLYFPLHLFISLSLLYWLLISLSFLLCRQIWFIKSMEYSFTIAWIHLQTAYFQIMLYTKAPRIYWFGAQDIVCHGQWERCWHMVRRQSQTLHLRFQVLFPVLSLSAVESWHHLICLTINKAMGLGMQCSWQNHCLASIKSWVQSSSLHKLRHNGMYL